MRVGGKTSDGQKFTNIRDFKKILLADKSQIARCLTEKLLTFALGREIGFSDRSAIEAIVSNVERQEYGFRSLIHTVIQSEMFRQK